MDKIAMQVEGSFFSDLAREAAAIDRSPSWLLAQCLRTWLPTIAKLEVREMVMPKGEKRTYWIPADLHADCMKIAESRGVPSDALIGSAWAARASRS